MVNPKPATVRWLDEELQVFIVVQANLKPHQAAFCHGKPHQWLWSQLLMGRQAAGFRTIWRFVCPLREHLTLGSVSSRLRHVQDAVCAVTRPPDRQLPGWIPNVQTSNPQVHKSAWGADFTRLCWLNYPQFIAIQMWKKKKSKYKRTIFNVKILYKYGKDNSINGSVDRQKMDLQLLW